MKMVHPDLLTNFPKAQAQNQESLSYLNDFIRFIRLKDAGPDNKDPYPMLDLMKLEFHLKPTTGGEAPKKVTLRVRTTGGRCPGLVRRQFEDFFQECKLQQPWFNWGMDYWATEDRRDAIIKSKETLDYQMELKRDKGANEGEADPAKEVSYEEVQDYVAGDDDKTKIADDTQESGATEETEAKMSEGEPIPRTAKGASEQTNWTAFKGQKVQTEGRTKKIAEERVVDSTGAE